MIFSLDSHSPFGFRDSCLFVSSTQQSTSLLSNIQTKIQYSSRIDPYDN